MRRQLPGQCAVQRRGKCVHSVGEPATDDHPPGVEQGDGTGERRAERRGDAIEGGPRSRVTGDRGGDEPGTVDRRVQCRPGGVEHRPGGVPLQPAEAIVANIVDVGARPAERRRRPVAAATIRPPLSTAEPMPVPIASSMASARSYAAPSVASASRAK